MLRFAFRACACCFVIDGTICNIGDTFIRVRCQLARDAPGAFTCLSAVIGTTSNIRLACVACCGDIEIIAACIAPTSILIIGFTVCHVWLTSMASVTVLMRVGTRRTSIFTTRGAG